MRKLRFLAPLLFGILATAADPAGVWSADIPGPGGRSLAHIFTIKTEGNKVTGTAKYGRGESPLVDGRLDGDVITFSVRYQAVTGIVQNTFQGTVQRRHGPH